MKYLILSLLVFSQLADAGIWHQSKIDLVYPQSDGSFIIGLVTENSTCENSSGFYRIYVGQYGVTIDGSNKMYAAALAAAAQQKEVEINFDAEAGQCYINRIKTFYY